MKKELFRFRFAGSGGQGVILGTIIMAEAALESGRNVVQAQSYGPEARGGSCKAEMIMSSGEIVFPKIECADCLAALTQKALDQYIDAVEPDGVIIVDSSVEVPDSWKGKTVSMPMIATAYDVLKKPVTINIVALGAINGVLGIVEDFELEQAVLARVPEGTEELNCRALEEGKKLSEGLFVEL